VGAGLVDFAIGYGMLFVLLFWYGIVPGPGLLFVPFLAFVLVIAALGVGTLLSALTVTYRDFRHLTPFLVQLWMFATPCIYMSEDKLPSQWHTFLPLNPAYGLIVNLRQAALGGHLNFYALAVSGAISLVVLLFGCMYFRRTERLFADVV
jgi:lipopolysaccharide transport system permease protein